jgi:hypothetical protein
MIRHPGHDDITHMGDVPAAAPPPRGTLAWVIFRRRGPLTLVLMTAPAARESLALLGSGVVLALLHPGVGLADALLRVLW